MHAMLSSVRPNARLGWRHWPSHAKLLLGGGLDACRVRGRRLKLE